MKNVKYLIFINKSSVGGFPNIEYEIIECGVFGRNHMFKGQPYQMPIDSFSSLDDAKSSYPRAKVVEDLPYCNPPSVPSYLD